MTCLPHRDPEVNVPQIMHGLFKTRLSNCRLVLLEPRHGYGGIKFGGVYRFDPPLF